MSEHSSNAESCRQTFLFLLCSMDDRPQRIADYFVVVGLGGSSATKFEPLGDLELEVAVDPAPRGNSGCEGAEPLTDVSLIHSKAEQLPQGYKVVDTTVGGQSANINSGSLFASPIYLCYRQGRDKPPIVEIGVYHTSSSPSPSPGHEALTESVDGRSASLSRSGRAPSYLTLKRGLLYGHNNAITGLCIIMPAKGEEPPAGYKVLKSLDLGKGLMGHSLFLCYCTNLVHPSSVPYTPELLTRYPAADHPEFALPESIPLFCLPSGVPVEHWERHTPFPLPTFSTFALTNAQGQCMYGAVVSFYEPLAEHRCLDDMRKALKANSEAALHVKKCICILSHWPFFSAFRSFLSSLYRLSVSSNIPLPLERYVGNLMTSVPFPTFTRPRVQMQIGNENIIFSLPVQTPLPLSVSTHWSLLSSLEPDGCLTLLSLTLLEQKLVLHSSRPALLTWVGEALRSILFPFAWQCTYIPVCPLAFSSYMQAPVPFIIGIDSHYFDVFEKPSDICIIDLDTGYITLSKEARILLDNKPLPSRPSKQLRHRLAQLRSKVVGLDTGLDLAVEVAPMEYTVTYKTDLEVVDVEIRDAFLHYFATIMGHYRKCLRPLLSAPSERSHDISLLFDQQLFLKHSPAADSAFFSHFFDTQIFTAFIEQRSFAHTENTALAFFDECAEKIRQNPHAQLLDAAAIVSRRSDLPTVVALPPDDAGLTKGETYSYPVFPSRLDSALFPPTSPAHTGGNGMKTHLSQHCIASVQSGSPMVARRTAAEKKKDNLALEAAEKSDVVWSKTLLSHVCSLWYVLLPPHLANHWNKMAVLSQAFELLEDMRKNQALPNDEVCYRILMEQCVGLGRPALAVKVYHQMIRAGIQPNAVTYGFYNKAVLESQWMNARIRWRACFIAITACLFLHNLKNEKKRVGSGRSLFGEADFSLISQRRNSVTSRKSIEALNVVGVAGGVASVEEGEGLKLHLPAASIHRGSVYRMTQAAGKGGVGGSSFSSIHHRSPIFRKRVEQGAEPGEKQEVEDEEEEPGLWSNIQLITGGQSANATRMLSRITSQINQGTFPSITIEMTSCTQCPSCHRVLYDEQLMSGWSCDDADYKTSCPYCHFKMVASLTITITKTLPPDETASPETPPTSAPQLPIREDEERVMTPDDRGKRGREGEEEGVEIIDFGSTWPKQNSSAWKRKQLRRAQPGGVLKGQSSNSIGGGEASSIRTRGESTENTPTTEEMGKATDKLAGALDNIPSTLVTPPRTDPLHRRAPTSNEKVDEDKVGVASGAGKTKPSRTSYVNLTPVHQRSKSKGDDLTEEPDGLGLSNYIAQMRARGHKRSTSAPIRARLKTTPTNGGVSIANHVQEKQHVEDGLDKKPYITESEPPYMVPYLSPIVLRKEVESLLSLDGPDALGRDELLDDKPIIYWNLVWYLSRLYLPTYLPLLKLRAFTKNRPDLSKHPVHLRVSLMWDRRFTEVRDPLYLIWEGKVPRTMKMFGTPELKRRDSESQLQSLVARTQCGDLFPVITSLLKDRSASKESQQTNGGGGASGEEGGKLLPRSRSIYRETLFLKSILNQSINTDLFDREFKQALQRVPRDLSSALEVWDHPPSGRALQCRRNFGPLQVI